MPKAIIPLFYAPPLPFLVAVYGMEEWHLEAKEHFVKATYRNRATIAGPNGALSLSIPLAGGKDKRFTSDSRPIQNDIAWQKHHWQSLCAAYRSSPYFEYYEDDYAPLYTHAYNTTWDFNLAMLKQILNHLKWDIDLKYTSNYVVDYGEDILDLRNRFAPNRWLQEVMSTERVAEHPYEQVFQNKTGFLHNLSILDLLFNEGPQSSEVIRRLAEDL